MKNSHVRKRWPLALLPLWVLPFVTLGFWALGGGTVQGQTTTTEGGLDMKLPEAHLTLDPGQDKLSFYEEAARDSMKWKGTGSAGSLLPGSFAVASAAASENPKRMQDLGAPGIYEKIAALNRQIREDTALKPAESPLTQSPILQVQGVGRLENLMARFDRDTAIDPGLTQLNAMMDKILAIQRAQSQARTTNKGDILHQPGPRVGSVGAPEGISRMEPAEKDTADAKYSKDRSPSTGFYAATGPEGESNKDSHPLWVSVYGTQTLTSGEAIRMRLLSPVEIKGHPIGRNCLIYGVTSLSGDRLQVRVNSIEYQGEIYAVSLVAYDLDGLSGICIPGGDTRQQARQSSADALQSLGYGSLDPSLGAQAAGAGIEAAKRLIAKKVKQVYVTVKSGYLLLLTSAISQP